MEALQQTLLISLKVTVAATFIAATVALAVAWGMARSNFRGKSLVDALLLVPLVLPPSVIGLLLIFLCGVSNPFAKFYEDFFGASILFSWQVAVLAASVVAFPLAYRTFYGAFEQISPSVLDSAKLLGASPWRIFRYVALPLAKPGLLAGVVLAFARALGEFGATLMVAGNIPGKTQTIPLAIYAATESGALKDAVALSIGAFSLNFVLLLISNYAARRREAEHTGIVETNWPSPHSLQSSGKQIVSVEFSIAKRFASYSLSVTHKSKGRVLGVLGSSGAGKSLLLKCLSGLQTPNDGYIKVGEKEIFLSASHDNTAAGKRRIAHMLQDYGLFPHMTAWENIEFAIYSLPHSQHTEAKSIAHKITTDLDLQSALNKHPFQLSGGQQQRVAIARSLVMAPDVLLLDEPLSALDSHLRFRAEATLKAAIKSYCGAAVIVTHNIEEAYRLCDELLLLDGGQVIVQGAKEAVFSDPKTVRGAELTGCKNIFALNLPNSTDKFLEDLSVALSEESKDSGVVDYLGVRANEISLVDKLNIDARSLSYPVSIESVTDSPFRVTISASIHSFDTPGHTLIIEMPRHAWTKISSSRALFAEIPKRALMPLRAKA